MFFLLITLHIQGMSESTACLTKSLATKEKRLEQAISKLDIMEKQKASKNQMLAQRRIISQASNVVRTLRGRLDAHKVRERNAQKAMNTLLEKDREKSRKESQEKCRNSCCSFLQKSLLAGIAVNAVLLYCQSPEW